MRWNLINRRSLEKIIEQLTPRAHGKGDTLSFTDRERLRRGGLLARLLLGRIALHLVLLFSVAVNGLDGRIPLLFVLLIFDYGCLEWNRRGKVRSACLWFLLGGMACASIILLFFTSHYAPASGAAFPLMALYVVASGFLLNRRAPLGVAMMSIGVIAFQGISGLAFAPHGLFPPLLLALLPSVMLILLAWIASLGAGSMETAIVRANHADEMERKYYEEAEAYSRLTEDHHEVKSQTYALESANTELIAIQTELAAQYKALEEANRQLASQATTDGMTGLANHRAFQEELQRQIARAERSGAALSLLLLDVDRFKQYNDSFGHPVGDEVLRTVANLLASQVREGDLPARYGGEEFAVVLPETDSDTARHIAERIRAVIAGYTFAHREVTVSIGVAQRFENETADAMIQRADVALYEAKSGGRNRVVYIPLAIAATAEAAALSNEMESGLLAVSERNPTPSRGEETELWEDAPYEIAAPNAAALASGGLEGLLQCALPEFLDALLEAMDRRGVEPRGHSERVTRYALRLAAAVSEFYETERPTRPLLPHLNSGDLSALAFGSLLHDLGKTGISDSVLRKRGQLTRDEWRQIRRHPLVGAEMLVGHPLLSRALPVVRYHHERWDGSGYPQGLAGEAIPLTARIFAVCDALENLTSERPYRSKRDYIQARDEIARGAGSQFDPDVVQAFLRVPAEQWLQFGEGIEASGELLKAA